MDQDLACIRDSIYNECQNLIAGKIKQDQLLTTLSDAIKLNENVINVLSDLLLLFDLETQNSEDKIKRETYIKFLSSCSNKFLNENILKERLDFDTTGESRIIPNKKTAHTKFIKLKTRLFYKQQKFNLFREESEGYAKLITELTQDGNLDVSYMLEVVQSLIGCFNLDPNRVIDVILECFEYRLDQHEFYIQLIKKFFVNKTSLTQIIAFKFSFYYNDINLTTSQNLYQVAAMLIKNSLISCDDIWDFMLPTDLEIKEYYYEALEESKRNSRKMNLTSNTEEVSYADKLDSLLKHSLFENNQKLNLCLHLFKVGDWINGIKIIDKLPKYYVVSDRRVSLELCNIIHYMIDDFYKEKSTLPSSIVSKIKPYKHKFGNTIEKIKNITEFKDIVFMLLEKLGPFIYNDTLLITKIIRIGKSIMNSSEENILRYELISLLDECILPSISFLESNYGLSEELWQLLKCFSYSVRYTLYHNLKSELQISTAIKNKSLIMKKVKYIMKRLSKENIRLFGRHIGKLTHSNPSILFEYILSQIQCYDNLIGPVVDSFKYLTSMSYDVLIYCVVEALGKSGKMKTSHDGLSISQWLLSLANFCGSVVKKYPVELPGLLQFIGNQLKGEKSLDLFVLKEIIQKMAGICTDEMTDDQLNALSGGEVLKNEGGYFNQVKNTRKSSMRLKEALVESNLAMPLCILMAQQRNCIVFRKQDHSHLKLLGKLYDQCQETLVQYGLFLSSNLSIDDYIGGLPSSDQLIQNYHLSSDVAFFLIRSMISYNINLQTDEIIRSSSKQNESKSKTSAYLEAWKNVTDKIANSMSKVMNKKLWDDLSPKFFVAFWTLTNYDLEVPKTSYEKEIERLKNQIQLTDDNKEMPSSKKKKEIERCRSLRDKLSEEQIKQEEHVKVVRAMLDEEKNFWFQQKVQKMEMTTQFLQHCLLPRCIFTANDASYCAEFVHLLHTIKTPNFSTLICYDRIFGDISYTMSSFTENEANNYGRFLCALLKTITTWHKDKEVFDKECAKYPGFVSKFCEKDPVHVDYESYRHVCHKWHYRLTKAFIICLDSGEYLQIRNSLIVLTKILPYLPIITSFAQAIEKRVEQIKEKEKEKRPDLYVLATGYSGQLKIKKSSFIPEDKFHIKAVKKTVKTEVKREVKRENSSSSEKFSPTYKEKKEVLKNDVDEKKKKIKNEIKPNKKEEKNDKVNDKNNDKKNIKTDYKSSATNSPKREHYSKSESLDSDKEYKRRKSDNKTHSHNNRDKDYDKKKTFDTYLSVSPSYRCYSPYSRKRDTNEVSSPVYDCKRIKDEDVKPKKSNEDKERKSSSSRRRETKSLRRKNENE